MYRMYEHREAVFALARSQNKFARDIYVKLASNSTGNLFFSPFSIMLALGMTLAGARGNTKTEMCKILHLAEDDEAIHDAFSDIVKDIKEKTPYYELRTANMAYISNQLRLLEAYVNILAGKYLSTSEVVDFSDEESVRKKINMAVEKETDSKIKNLIAEGVLNSDTRMALVNAVYFRGFWDNEFKEINTQEKDFWIYANASVKLPMMKIKAKFGYTENRDLKATLLKMPYRGGGMSMVFILPNARDGLAALEAKLATFDFSELARDYREAEVEVFIPKFKLEESLDLEDHLSDMGMKDLFSEKNADLSGISGTRDLFVTKVIHKAFLEVNEKGCEAAASRAVSFGVMAFSLYTERRRFNANHPFLFFIDNDRSELIMFMGKFNGDQCGNLNYHKSKCNFL